MEMVRSRGWTVKIERRQPANGTCDRQTLPADPHVHGLTGACSGRLMPTGR